MNTHPHRPGNIVWLASYPKSGNTWLRVFLANLLSAGNQAVHINDINLNTMASSRSWIESAVDFALDELCHDEIDQLRPAAYVWLSHQLNESHYCKVHDAYTYLEDGSALFPPTASKGAIYIVRNPLDVCVSLSYHLGVTIKKAIDLMTDSNHCFCHRDDKMYPQVRQKLLSWSEHVASWVDAPAIDKYLVRYEDMKQSPTETFSGICSFLDIDKELPTLQLAIQQSEISNLQLQETSGNFLERSIAAEKFFRKGVIGDWQNHLNGKQVDQIIDSHGEVMRRLGYLDNNGNLASDILI